MAEKIIIPKDAPEKEGSLYLKKGVYLGKVTSIDWAKDANGAIRKTKKSGDKGLEFTFKIQGGLEHKEVFWLGASQFRMDAAIRALKVDKKAKDIDASACIGKIAWLVMKEEIFMNGDKPAMKESKNGKWYPETRTVLLELKEAVSKTPPVYDESLLSVKIQKAAHTVADEPKSSESIDSFDEAVAEDSKEETTADEWGSGGDTNF